MLTYRPSRSGVAKLFGELEGEVMEEVWRSGSATVREVHQTLNHHKRGIAYTTVLTVMARLNEKGILGRAREGNAFRYFPTRSREEFLAQASLEIFSGLARDLSGPVMSAFVDRLSEGEARRLRELARLIESKKRARRSRDD